MRGYFLNAVVAVLYSLLNIYGLSAEDRGLHLIPMPMEYELGQGYFAIDSVALFSGMTHEKVHYMLDPQLSELGSEGYCLEVTSDGVLVKAYSKAGLFYGKMTLRQLCVDNRLPYIRIKDKPRFQYRGIMLDVSRHFFSKEDVKRMIDQMAMYKLNRFHWHLTDDGGWRFEVKEYPRLVEESAFRTHHSWQEWWKNGGKFVNMRSEGACGGYYTDEDIREIIEYAADRFVTIIPEVEFPGHSREVFAAYPELCCTGEAYSSRTFCAGNRNTYLFMESVLNAIMDLFPSEMIHIGGDETDTAHWKECPKCQALMRLEEMKNVSDLHKYVIGKAERIIEARGRRMIGWDEIAEGQLDKKSVIMSWRGTQAGIDAARKGYDVVLTPLHYLYLDYFQSSPDKEPLAHDGYTTVEKVYSYNPVPNTIDSESITHVLGIQGNLWTEWISDRQHLEYMAYPRALAVAELAWSVSEKISWDNFKKRLSFHIGRLQEMGINTYSLSPDVETAVETDEKQQKLLVTLKCEKEGIEIRYTEDGTLPTLQSTLYTAPLYVVDSLCLKAATFKEGIMEGDVLEEMFYYHKGIGKSVISGNREQKILADGCKGGKTYLDGTWFNFSGDREFLLDLEKVETVNTVAMRWMQLRAGARRYLPTELEMLLSDDGQNFFSCGTLQKETLSETPVLQYQNFVFKGNWKARYIKIKVKAGGGGMSADEIIVL